MFAVTSDNIDIVHCKDSCIKSTMRCIVRLCIDTEHQTLRDMAFDESCNIELDRIYNKYSDRYIKQTSNAQHSE